MHTCMYTYVLVYTQYADMILDHTINSIHYSMLTHIHTHIELLNVDYV